LRRYSLTSSAREVKHDNALQQAVVGPSLHEIAQFEGTLAPDGARTGGAVNVAERWNLPKIQAHRPVEARGDCRHCRTVFLSRLSSQRITRVDASLS